MCRGQRGSAADGLPPAWRHVQRRSRRCRPDQADDAKLLLLPLLQIIINLVLPHERTLLDGSEGWIRRIHGVQEVELLAHKDHRCDLMLPLNRHRQPKDDICKFQDHVSTSQVEELS